MRYRPEIDGLRALAVLPVIFFHAGFDAFRGGFVGVDIFFVISGFLITSIVVNDLQKNEFSLTEFYVRRARRILPALFFLMAVCIFLFLLVMLPHQIKYFSKSIIAASLFVSNIQFWLEGGYFEEPGELKPLFHLWSLAIEEQFYVLFPISLFLIWRLGQNVVLSFLIVAVLLSFLICEIGSHKWPSANFYLLPSRAWELLLGSVGAISLRNIKFKPSELFSFLGLGLVIVSFFVFDKDFPFPSSYTIIPVLGALLILFFCNETTLVGRALGTKPLVNLGILSYGLYLWHYPVFVFYRLSLLREPSPLEMLMLCLLSIAIAYFSWRFIEAPIRRYKTNRLKNKKTLFFSLAGVSVFLMFGIYAYINDGLQNRAKILIGDVGHSQFLQHIDKNFFNCEDIKIANSAPMWDGVRECKQSQKGEPNTILLGDSHAEHLFIGFAETLKESNVSFLVQNGTPLISNHMFSEIYESLTKRVSAKTILFTFSNARIVGSNASTDKILHELSKTIEKLKTRRHQIILVGDIPFFDVNVGHCIYKHSFNLVENNHCKKLTSTVIKEHAVYDMIFRQLSEKYEIPYISLLEFFCDSDFCRVEKDGMLLYRDSNHLNIEGSRLVADFIVDTLERDRIEFD